MSPVLSCTLPSGRGLHSSTFQLNVSAVCGLQAGGGGGEGEAGGGDRGVDGDGGGGGGAGLGGGDKRRSRQ